VEAIASGPNAVRNALADGWQPAPGVTPDGIALAGAAAAGDPVATRSLARAGRAVGVAIASCASLLDLEMAAIVGGFSQSGPLFWQPLQQAFATHAGLPFAAACRVVPGKLGAAAGLLGAAAFVLVPDRYGWDPDPGRV
jgi:glucokinase